MKVKFLLPLLGFLVLLGFLAIGLKRDPTEVPSPLVGKPAPAFDLAQLNQPAQRFSPAAMQGRVWLMNVWASWCVSCREEHPLLMNLAQQKLVPLIGLNYRDKAADAQGVLTKSGNPYDIVAFDTEGRVGIDYGVYGVPETYVIDKRGIIRYKQIGVITPDLLEQKILPLVRELQKAS